MTTALITRGFHEITSGQWTWQEMAHIFRSSDNIKNIFYGQQNSNARVSLFCNLIGIFVLRTHLSVALGHSLSSKHRQFVDLGLIAWFGGVTWANFDEFPEQLSP